MDAPLRKIPDTPLRNVRANIVQSIRAYRVEDLQQAAETLGCHFLYANLAHAQTKADILELLATQFFFPAHFGKNFDALYDCLTDPIHKAGPQPGFVLVLDQIPTTPKFDKEVRDSHSFGASLNVPEALIHSSNVVTAQIADRLGPVALKRRFLASSTRAASATTTTSPSIRARLIRPRP